jgi:hypothetical protein
MFRATADTFEPAANVSEIIVTFSFADQWRRRSPLAKILTCIDPMASSLDSRSHASPISPTNMAVLTEGMPFRYDDRP